MKKLITFIYCFIFLAAGIILNGCDNPAPTELVQDNSSTQTPVQIEVITKDPTDEFYNNGFDTTGVAAPVMNYSNVINVSGIKITTNNVTTKISFAQAIFYNKNLPIKEPGGRLIGYQTVTPGKVKFNNIMAMTIPYKIRYNSHGMHADTTLGNMFALTRGMMGPSGQFNFDYNSSINFQYIPMHGNSVNFNIPTPREIIGKVILTGRIENKTLNCLLDWNSLNQSDSIEIILGVVTKAQNPNGTNSILPLYKIKTRDTGRLLIPPKLVNEIPQSKFGKVVLTFIRKYQIHYTDYGNDLFVLSQSIHSITLDIP
ncbi:MAG: hypothetical protein M1480_01035 [Bacteroidetes bacterium]|nr:hypothetical protein [Bacteroidota bacterium]